MWYNGKVKGMTCTSCEKVIENTLFAIPGVKRVRVSYVDGSLAVKHDSRAGRKDFAAALAAKGYEIEESGSITSDVEDRSFFGIKLPPVAIALGALMLLLGAYFIISGLEIADLPQIDSNAGFAALLLLGLVTSVHCVAMCGGFVVSYSSECAAKGDKSFMPHALYGAGKLISYTTIGALFGLLGSFIAITLEMRALAAIVAGLFLLLFGLNTLNIFPQLRGLMPRLPNLGASITKQKNNSPFTIGLANGLFIACGPLQAMYVLAAGTGSPMAGAFALFAFGLGTLPAMIGFGMVASKLTAKMHGFVTKFSGALVIFLALLMLNNGFTLLGGGLSASSIGEAFSIGQSPSYGAASAGNGLYQEASSSQIAGVLGPGSVQEVYMEVSGYGYSPNKLVVKKGIPVRWIINATRITGCNNEIIMREYGIDIKLKPGIQVVEFTPVREGTVQFSCWMGMLRGAFVVTSAAPTQAEVKQAQTVQVAAGGSCGGSGGGCGCGGAR